VDAFFIALQFLTRIPIHYRHLGSDAVLGRSVLYYPAVGLLLGIMLAIPASLLSDTAPLMLAALILGAWVLLTGGLHLDGLADCADAWVGGYDDRQRSLQIMKDPASGPIAVCLLVVVLILKFAALTTMLEQGRLAPLLLAPVLGRAAILVLMLTTAYVRPRGLAETLLQQLPISAAYQVVAVCALLGLAVLGLPTILATGLLLWWVRQTAVSRLGGVTGDVYGAAVELVEVVVLSTALLR